MADIEVTREELLDLLDDGELSGCVTARYVLARKERP